MLYHLNISSKYAKQYQDNIGSTLHNDKLENLDSYIENVDFYVSIDEVAKLVQPMTDLLLKDL